MTPAKTVGAVLAALAAVFLLAVVSTPLTIAFGWYTGEANLRSFNHVKATYQEAYDDVNAMEANVRQSCRIRAMKSADANTQNQRDSQLLAIENNYDRVKAEYEAYMSDHFRGKIIRPQSLPMPYPELAERQQAVC